MKKDKIDFMIIGAMKSSTTSLHAYLNQHPELFLCEPKEPDYFIEEKNLNKGIDWFHGLFSQASENMLLGEASTSYSKYPEFKGVPQRIFDYNPDIKIIYLLRNPIERSISHYRHSLGFGRVDGTFEEEIKKDNNKYVECSKYFMQIGKFLEYFDKSQILVTQSERLISQPGETLQNILKFLSVDSKVEFDVSQTHNSSAAKTERSGLNKALKKSKFINAVKKAVPRSVVEFYFKISEKPLSKVELSTAGQKYLTDEFRDDVTKLFKEFELDKSYWPQWFH